MKSLHPFFCYYGGKFRGAPKYPAPTRPTIIEPFAGSAGYSLRHYHKEVVLYDVYPVICGIWDYLIRVRADEVLSLPVKFDHVDEVDAPQEARWLISFWINKASASPHKTPSSWMKSGVRPNSHWGEVIRERVASQVDKIRHWKVCQKSYADIPDSDATWFVDPPYQGPPGKLYRHKILDYAALGEWCRSRTGQVVVCERDGADWLPFRTLGKFKAAGGRGNSHSNEVIWTNSDRVDRDVEVLGPQLADAPDA